MFWTNFKALEEERLPDDAKAEALEVAHKAVAALNELGFPYRLVEGTSDSPRAAIRASRGPSGPRRQTGDCARYASLGPSLNMMEGASLAGNKAGFYRRGTVGKGANFLLGRCTKIFSRSRA